jgi:hypothetical protein
MRLQEDSPEERENAACMLVDIADNEPELLSRKELRAAIPRLQEAGDKEACTHLRKALRKMENAPTHRRHKYGI